MVVDFLAWREWRRGGQECLCSFKLYCRQQNEIHYGVASGYANSSKYQDKVKGFNHRVVMVLIRHIERYLTKIGIDMGMDEMSDTL